jgi:hypothetical protein
VNERVGVTNCYGVRRGELVLHLPSLVLLMLSRMWG